MKERICSPDDCIFKARNYRKDLLCIFWAISPDFWKLLIWRTFPMLTFKKEGKKTFMCNQNIFLVVLLSIVIF